MNVGELQVKESFDGELYFRIPDEIMNRLGWKEGDDLKFIPRDGGFMIKKMTYESVEVDFDKDDLMKYLLFAHERGITFDELCTQAVQDKLSLTSCFDQPLGPDDSNLDCPPGPEGPAGSD